VIQGFVRPVLQEGHLPGRYLANSARIGINQCDSGTRLGKSNPERQSDVAASTHDRQGPSHFPPLPQSPAYCLGGAYMERLVPRSRVKRNRSPNSFRESAPGLATFQGIPTNGPGLTNFVGLVRFKQTRPAFVEPRYEPMTDEM
jgi:hypothetical protein